ncbi:unnamed protein product [marine sediment metagenome]|uniref:Uncharacterized protein n=1 Tax=marine sediment metagenome TaxID=412755 RepID=X1RL06_9ZZZZ
MLQINKEKYKEIHKMNIVILRGDKTIIRNDENWGLWYEN